MVGKVDNGVLIGGRRILDSQSATVQRVAHVRDERAGKTLISVFAYMS